MKGKGRKNDRRAKRAGIKLRKVDDVKVVGRRILGRQRGSISDSCVDAMKESERRRKEGNKAGTKK